MTRMLVSISCLALMLVPCRGAEPKDETHAEGFPPTVIRAEAVKELVKDAKVVGHGGGMGPFKGKVVGFFCNSHCVELPGFEGKQEVSVGYIQKCGTICYFHGPGFSYDWEDGKLIRKKLVRLSSQDYAALERGMRYVIESQGYADGRSLFLDLFKDDDSFRPTKAFLKRLSDLDVTWKMPDTSIPDKPKYDRIWARIVSKAANRVEFWWNEILVGQGGPKRTAYNGTFDLELRDGAWVKVDKQNSQ